MQPLIENINRRIKKLFSKLLYIDIHSKRMVKNRIYRIEELKKTALALEFNFLNEIGIWNIVIYFDKPSKVYSMLLFDVDMNLVYKCFLHIDDVEFNFSEDGNCVYE